MLTPRQAVAFAEAQRADSPAAWLRFIDVHLPAILAAVRAENAARQPLSPTTADIAWFDAQCARVERRRLQHTR